MQSCVSVCGRWVRVCPAATVIVTENQHRLRIDSQQETVFVFHINQIRLPNRVRLWHKLLPALGKRLVTGLYRTGRAFCEIKLPDRVVLPVSAVCGPQYNAPVNLAIMIEIGCTFNARML